MLEQGYEMTALVINPEKLALKSAKLRIVEGSPTNQKDVQSAMDGCDILIGALSALLEQELLTFRKAEASHTLEKS